MGALNKVQQKADIVADVGAATSVITVLGLTLGQWETIVSICASAVAIIAGAAAAWYHLTRVRRLNQTVDKVSENVETVKDEVHEIKEKV